MNDLTPQWIFEHILIDRLATKPELRKEIDASVGFIIEGPHGGTWTLDMTRDSNWLESGIVGTPKMTMKAAEADFVAVCSKKLNPQLAAMSGKLKFKPMDVGLAMKLAKLLA